MVVFIVLLFVQIIITLNSDEELYRCMASIRERQFVRDAAKGPGGGGGGGEPVTAVAGAAVAVEDQLTAEERHLLKDLLADMEEGGVGGFGTAVDGEDDGVVVLTPEQVAHVSQLHQEMMSVRVPVGPWVNLIVLPLVHPSLLAVVRCCCRRRCRRWLALSLVLTRRRKQKRHRHHPYPPILSA